MNLSLEFLTNKTRS